nr:immunoglobulin heavy chain junction region [Mus musculus]
CTRDGSSHWYFDVW